MGAQLAGLELSHGWSGGSKKETEKSLLQDLEVGRGAAFG